MPQLLTWRRGCAVPADIHSREGIHHVAHSHSTRISRHSSRSSSSAPRHRRWRIEKPHDIRHAAAGLWWRTGKTADGSRAGEPIWGADATTMLCAGGGAAVKVDVEKVLNVVLLAALSSGSDGRGNGVLGGVLALFLDGGALDLVGAEAALADEGLGRLVVDRGESGKLGKELFEEDGREGCYCCRNGGLLGENDAL